MTDYPLVWSEDDPTPVTWNGDPLVWSVPDAPVDAPLKVNEGSGDSLEEVSGALAASGAGLVEVGERVEDALDGVAGHEAPSGLLAPGSLGTSSAGGRVAGAAPPRPACPEDET